MPNESTTTTIERKAKQKITGKQYMVDERERERGRIKALTEKYFGKMAKNGKRKYTKDLTYWYPNEIEINRNVNCGNRIVTAAAVFVATVSPHRQITTSALSDWAMVR